MNYFFSPSTIGFYIEGIHDPMPSDCIAVTEDQHAACMKASQTGATFAVQDGHLVIFNIKEDEEKARSVYLDAIVNDAQIAYEKIGTTNAGITAEKQMALEQANDFLNDTVAYVPIVEEWATITGTSVKDAALDIVTAANKTNAAILRIRTSRLNAAKAVRESATIDAMRDAYAQFGVSIKEATS